MSMSNERARELAHDFAWKFGMCLAGMADPYPQHGNVCQDATSIILAAAREGEIAGLAKLDAELTKHGYERARNAIAAARAELEEKRG